MSGTEVITWKIKCGNKSEKTTVNDLTKKRKIKYLEAER